MILARLGWSSFVVNRKEVRRRRRRRMLVVFRGLVLIGLGKGEGNDPVFLRQEMRRSARIEPSQGVLGWRFMIQSD